MKNYNSIHHFLIKESENPRWFSINDNLPNLISNQSSEINKISQGGFRSITEGSIDNDLLDSAFFKAKIDLIQDHSNSDYLPEVNNIRKLNSIADRSIKNKLIQKLDFEIANQLKVSDVEMSSFIWFSVISSSVWEEVLRKAGIKSLKSKNVVQLAKHADSNSYSLLYYHPDTKKTLKYNIPNDLKLELADSIVNSNGNTLIQKIIKSSPDYPENIATQNFNKKEKIHFSQKAKELVSKLNMEKFYNLFLNLDFEIFFLPYPAFENTAYHVKKSTGVGALKGSYFSSAGVIAKNNTGKYGITFCYHDFIQSSSKCVGDKIYVDGKEAIIESLHKPSDSCFATFSDQKLNLSNYLVNMGPLKNVGPGINTPVKFTGITSQNSSTIIQAIDPSIPFIKPSSNIINMQKVYTPPSSQPGDSGAALIDDKNNVIGFAAYRTGYNSPIPFSVWVWADEIFYHHKLKIK